MHATWIKLDLTVFSANTILEWTICWLPDQHLLADGNNDHGSNYAWFFHLMPYTLDWLQLLFSSVISSLIGCCRKWRMNTETCTRDSSWMKIRGQNFSTTYRSISGNTTRFWPIRAWLRGLFLPLLRKMSNHWFRKVNKSLIHFRDAICKYVDGEDFEIVYEHPALQDEEWWCLHEDKLDSYSTNTSSPRTIKIWNTSWIYHLPYLLSAPFLYIFVGHIFLFVINNSWT